jgi:hypothetical protein
MTGAEQDQRTRGERVQTTKRITRTSALSCSDLEGMGLLDTTECCETCHSAEGHALDGVVSLGHCRATLSDGREAFVCCAARKQLSGGAAS